MSNPFSIDNYSRPNLELPNGEKRLLLHSCCAPCDGEIMEAVEYPRLKQQYFFTILIFILKRNMRFAKMRISVFVTN